MTRLTDDSQNREVWFETDGMSIDTYQVIDPNDSNYTFSLDFPYQIGDSLAYSIINQIPVRGLPNLCPFTELNSESPWGSCRTCDRQNMFATLGMCVFDLDLGKPIWYKGSGSTGWVDASGAEV